MPPAGRVGRACRAGGAGSAGADGGIRTGDERGGCRRDPAVPDDADGELRADRAGADRGGAYLARCPTPSRDAAARSACGSRAGRGRRAVVGLVMREAMALVVAGLRLAPLASLTREAAGAGACSASVRAIRWCSSPGASCWRLPVLPRICQLSTRRVGGSDAGAADGVIGDCPQSQSSWGDCLTAVQTRAAGRANVLQRVPVERQHLRQNFRAPPCRPPSLKRAPAAAPRTDPSSAPASAVSAAFGLPEYSAR